MRVWNVVPVVLALLVARPVLAAPPLPADSGTVPVIRGGQVTQLDPAELVPATQYYISIRCLRGGEVINESQAAITGGAPGVITGSNQRDGRVRYSTYVEVAAPDLPQGAPQAIEPQGGDNAVPPEVLAAAQKFSCAGLKFTVYCPGADWIEVEVERSVTDAPWLRRLPGELLPEFVPGVEHPFQFAGRLSCALSCADMGYV